MCDFFVVIKMILSLAKNVFGVSIRIHFEVNTVVMCRAVKTCDGGCRLIR